jgi:hypothetical protein
MDSVRRMGRANARSMTLSILRFCSEFQIAERQASAFSRRALPEFCQDMCSSEKQRAQGRPGARCTRGLVCKMHKKRRTRAYRFSGGNPAFPARMVLTVSFVLSSATNSSCHRHPRIEGDAEPGWADIATTNLTPATGARTTRLRRPHQRRSSARRILAHELPWGAALQFLCAPTLPRPPRPAHIRDDRETPLVRAGWGELVAVICPTG